MSAAIALAIPARIHAQAAGFVPAYPRRPALPPVTFGQHVTITPALDEGVRLSLFPHVSGETMLTVQAPGLHTALHLPLATLEGLVAAGAAIVALCQAASRSTDLTPIASPPGSTRG